MHQPDRLQDPGDAERGELSGEDRLGPGGGHVGLGGEVVDLVRLGVLQHHGEGVLVEQVGRHHLDPVEQMLDPLVAVMAGATHHADHLVALGEEELREVGAILPGDAGDQRLRHGGPRCEVVSWSQAR